MESVRARRSGYCRRNSAKAAGFIYLQDISTESLPYIGEACAMHLGCLVPLPAIHHNTGRSVGQGFWSLHHVPWWAASSVHVGFLGALAIGANEL
jgi:hypothetical protein